MLSAGVTAATRDHQQFAPHEWAGSAFDATDVERKYDVLRDFCATAYRPYESILRSHYAPLLVLAGGTDELARKEKSARISDPNLTVRRVLATPEDAVLHYQGLADAGVQYFNAGIDGDDQDNAPVGRSCLASRQGGIPIGVSPDPPCELLPD